MRLMGRSLFFALVAVVGVSQVGCSGDLFSSPNAKSPEASSIAAPLPESVDRVSQSFASLNVSSAPLLVGFWGNAVTGSGSGDYIRQSASIASNVVMVGSDSVAVAVARVREAATVGRKTIIMLQYLLYPWQSALPHADFRARFDALWAALGADQVNIAGFYIYDEPYARNETFGVNKVYWGFVHQGLDDVAGYAKARTGLPTLMIFSPTEVAEPSFATAFLPANVDIFGVDCYLAFGDMCSETAFANLVSIMKAARHPNQKLLFVLDGTWKVSAGPAPDLALNFRNRFIAKLIGENLGITGAVMPFLFQNDPAEGLIGLESLPLAREAVGVYLAGYLNQVRCLGDDLFNTVSGERWPNAPYCQPACEGTALVRRTIKGEIAETWPEAPMCH